MIRLGLIALILVASVLAASTWRVFGHTWDEPEHLAAGLELLDRGKYEYDTEHPPLARALIALGPFLAGSHSFGTPPPDGTQEGIDILYAGGHYERTLTLARLGTLPFLALLFFALWLWARQAAESDGEALLAVLLLASVPPIIGHAALATLDVPAAATTLLALYLLQSWLESGSRRAAVVFGLAAGVAVGTKLSAIPFIGLGVLVLLLVRVIVSAPPALMSGGRRITGLFIAGLAALLPIALAYGPRSLQFTPLPPRFGWMTAYLFQGVHPTAVAVISRLNLPQSFWDFAEGVVALEAHNHTGHLSYLFGSLKAGGWWYFYLVALAVKTPLPLLVAGPAGMWLLARDGWRERNPWRAAPLALFTILLAFASAFSRINIGIRHVLILYPFMALGAAYLLAFAWRRWSTTGPRVALAALVCWQVSSLVSAYPDYFPYFNETVSRPERVLIDSDLDWGQDLRRLELRLHELHVPQVSLAYQGTADLAREPLPPFVRLPPWHKASGWVAINALTREHQAAGYAWLDSHRPVERIGKTIDLYHIAP